MCALGLKHSRYFPGRWGSVMMCEVCSIELFGPILDLGFHPLCDDLEASSASAFAKKFHQEIQLCSNCLTAHQLHQVPKEDLFKPSYHYRSSLTKDVISGMKSLVESSLDTLSKKEGLLILDVGCNDGALLRIFKDKSLCTTIGVDPTDAIKDQTDSIDHPFQAFFDIKLATEIKARFGSPDLITFTNVFAHIENLPELIEALKVLLSKKTKIIIENHYLGAILNRAQFDTFYHEHPRTYSAKSFMIIAERLGLEVSKIEFPSRYGGNIRVTLSHESMQHNLLLDEVLQKEEKFIEDFSALQYFFDSWREESMKTISLLTESGPIYGKSLPGRAVMLISSLGLASSHMPKIFEQQTSPKVGYCVPATDIEIAPDSELLFYAGNRLIVWSWHIIEEICEYLAQIGYKGEVWVPLPKLEKYKTI